MAGRLRRLLLAALLAAVAGCGDPPDRLARVKERGVLRVLTTQGPTTFYEGRDGLAGPEYEMALAFARWLEVRLEMLPREGVAHVLADLAAGGADVAAAGLSRTPERARRFLFGPVYQQVQQQVVCRRGGARPRTPAQLARLTLVVPAGTSYAERLQVLARGVPDLRWTAEPGLDTETALERVWQRKADCTVADSNIVAVVRRYFPELSVRFALGEPDELSWMFPASAHRLRDAAREWFTRYAASGELQRLHEKYYGFIESFDYVDVRAFRRRIRTVLPRYRPLFERAAARHGLDWMLLAALSYQESHWNPRARSPTGVRGIMMLTLTTARELGVKSRLDPAQSIEAAARYLARLRARLPAEVREPDRTWFALAAYNVGYGHLRDAMTLARRLGRNPHRWADLRAVLPLLAKKKYYRTLRHGYARGWEPVRYVQRVRDFEDMLRRALADQESVPAAAPPKRRST